MFNTIHNRFNWRSGKARVIMTAVICAAGLAVGVGGTIVLAQMTGGNPTSNTENMNTPNNEKCVDANSKCAGPPNGLPGGVFYTCNISATPPEFGDACYSSLVQNPGENSTCAVYYKGINCKYTTNTTQTPCYKYQQGTCNLVDVAGVDELQCQPIPPKFMASKPGADFVVTCVNQY